MSAVEIDHIGKSFGGLQVLHDININVDEGEFCVLVGPSGCGKSTLLRTIAGLEQSSSGTLKIAGNDVTHADAARRGISMVFQSYALYPHMTVRENIGFGLKIGKVAPSEIRARVDEIACILRLEDYLERRPKQLSGGQRQRVAIGRAIVREPKVILFDEPLSNLDAELRAEMRVEIAKLHKRLKSTIIYVTHDQVEAMTLADRIVIMRKGSVEQIGTPMQLYREPANKFVAGFIGSPPMNFLDVECVDGHLDCPGLGQEVKARLPDGSYVLGIRPEHLSLDRTAGNLTVDIVEKLGATAIIYLQAQSGERLIVSHPSSDAPMAGERVSVRTEANSHYIFDRQTERMLANGHGT
ncbi:ABC transporter ATP-binding protein [Rhizobium hainanense]|uniref:Carbohydrate ABC transporter ATP-binding protein, CUT1 family n=1 Tax=Rhizobium hainanense TaxID=52131 RepID=A0A1C3W9K3_9HYPH|nr:sn-glycerol-3-phosphate ABC transporter ATP-binding protein UgpC [Rhizobium hainanense]SCB36586.1 carbohydrate ABC transporter ATP-binding protein, CUT1 family [Rhizobium hainanense]